MPQRSRIVGYQSMTVIAYRRTCPDGSAAG
jgi:hypothetical protein